MNEYKKSLDDTIDWAIIDQLHSATARFSTTCTEVKKIYISVLAIVVPVIIQLSGNEQDKFKLDHSLFVSIYIITPIFWYLDSYSYYYQEFLRSLIDKRFEKIKSRHLIQDEENKSSNLGKSAENNKEVSHEEPKVILKEEYTLDDKRKANDRLWRSIKNPSVMIYPVILAINTILFILFICRIIA